MSAPATPKVTTLPQFVTCIVNYSSGDEGGRRRKRNLTNFYRVYNGLVSGPGNWISSLSPVTDNLERIRMVRNLLLFKIRGIIDACLVNPLQLEKEGAQDESDPPVTAYLLRKHDTVSEMLRQEGNNFYKRKLLAQALRAYTLASSFAPHGSKNQALAYSNRSACFLESNAYEKALRDIDMFEELSQGWTEDTDLRIVQRVSERKLKCLEKLKPSNNIPKAGRAHEQIQFADKLFRLTSSNPSIPAAQSSIGIRQDGSRGRYVCNVSDSDVQPGTVLILEEPYAKVLLRLYSLEAEHCTHCLKDLAGGGIPCKRCVFGLYCSRECEKASEPLHSKYECKIGHFLYELNMNRTVYLALSILMKLGPHGVLEYMGQENHNRHPESNGKENNNQEESKVEQKILGFSREGIYDSTSYDTIYNLIYHRGTLKEAEVRRYCSDALLVTEILDLKTDFFDSLNLIEPDKRDVKDCFASLVLLHQMNLPCNAHSLYKLNLPNLQNPTSHQIKTAEYEEVGAAAFSLLSMINHSCDPNVVRVSLRNGVNAVIAVQTIRSGEEVLDNYGVHYATSPLNTRLRHLRDVYNFDCSCTACVHRFPSITELVRKSDTDAVQICTSCRDNDNMILPEIQQACKSCNSVEFTDQLKLFASRYSKAVQELGDHYNAVAAYSECVECLKYYEQNVRKPYKYVNLSQEVMKQALFLIARHLFS